MYETISNYFQIHISGFRLDAGLTKPKTALNILQNLLTGLSKMVKLSAFVMIFDLQRASTASLLPSMCRLVFHIANVSTP
jgi:hypothetical protein